jgi:hypothetical protein
MLYDQHFSKPANIPKSFCVQIQQIETGQINELFVRTAIATTENKQ